MFSLIKSKLSAFMLGGMGILAIIATTLYGLLQREKKKAVEQDLIDTEVAQEHSRRATEAMTRGVSDEHTKEHDSRKYDFTD